MRQSVGLNPKPTRPARNPSRYNDYRSYEKPRCLRRYVINVLIVDQAFILGHITRLSPQRLRSHLIGPGKNVPEVTPVTKPCFASDGFKRMTATLNQISCRFETKTLDCLGGRFPGLGKKNTRKLSAAEMCRLRKIVDAKGLG